VRFKARELGDFFAAWILLSVAFAIFFAGGGSQALRILQSGDFITPVIVSLFTAGIGFLFHELGHKYVAVRFGQKATFQAEYGMLFVALMSAVLGFIFAAPGAVHHRGMITERQHGIIALAGPATNVLLAVGFIPVFLYGGTFNNALLRFVGGRGLIINVFLAGFNLLPLGSLDGKVVFQWHKSVHVGLLISLLGCTVFLWINGIGI
jgi:Peptidase family M50.